MNKLMMMRGAALLAILGFASVATAKSVQALIWAPNYSSGSTFTLCNGNSLWAQATGRDNSGVVVCGFRQTKNTLWGTGACPSGAITHNASLRSINASHCASPSSGWGTLQFCAVNNFFMKVNGGACVNGGTVNVWSNAIN
jgi:hypothetical protein